MKAVLVLSLFLNAVIASKAAVLPTSQIAFDDFAKHDVAADVARDVTTDTDFDMAAVFNAFAQREDEERHVYDETAEASPEAEDPEPSIEPLLTTTAMRNIKQPMESPEELMPSTENMDFSIREEVISSPEALEATPEDMSPMHKRRAGPMEIPEATVEASIEPELLEGLE